MDISWSISNNICLKTYAQTETMALTAPLARSPSRLAFINLLKGDFLFKIKLSSKIIFTILLLGPLSSSAGKVFPLVKLKVIIIFLF